MLKKCLLIRLYLYQLTTRSFFKPIQDGMDRPKTEFAYRVPASKFTRKKITKLVKVLEEIQGLDTTIDWKNTGDNSYDGEKT